jgi:hypothetical protein
VGGGGKAVVREVEKRFVRIDRGHPKMPLPSCSRKIAVLPKADIA